MRLWSFPLTSWQFLYLSPSSLPFFSCVLPHFPVYLHLPKPSSYISIFLTVADDHFKLYSPFLLKTNHPEDRNDWQALCVIPLQHLHFSTRQDSEGREKTSNGGISGISNRPLGDLLRRTALLEHWEYTGWVTTSQVHFQVSPNQRCSGISFREGRWSLNLVLIAFLLTYWLYYRRARFPC